MTHQPAEMEGQLHVLHQHARGHWTEETLHLGEEGGSHSTTGIQLLILARANLATGIVYTYVILSLLHF